MSNPQVPVNGTLGTNGIFPLVNSPGVVFATDANHTMSYPEMSGSSVLLSTLLIALSRLAESATGMGVIAPRPV